jgi:hypothetical protein
MDLEKVASELAQKAVAVRNSDTRLAPGEYPAWASEFKKLAEEHYAELGLAKEAAGEDYNPYSRYDQAVQGNEVLSNPLVRNALVTGGLGAGVGALGSLASNLLSKKRKKRYLSDALSAGLMGGLAGGVGGAGYTALTDNKATNDLVGQVSKALGGTKPPPANRNAALEGERAAIEDKTMGQLNPALAKAQTFGNMAAAGVGLKKPVTALGKGLATGQFTTTADTAKMLSHAEQQLNAFRDSLADSSKKGLPTGNRQAIFNDFLKEHNLVDTNGVIKVKDPRHLSAALQDLKNLNSRTEAPPTPIPPAAPSASGRRLSKPIDTNTLLHNIMGTNASPTSATLTTGASPGVLQSFSNPELAARRLNAMTRGGALSAAEAANFINQGYAKPSPALVSLSNNPPGAKSYRFYDGKGLARAALPSVKGSVGAAGLALASNYGLPYLNNNPEARTENTQSFLDKLRQDMATAKSPEIAGSREQILKSLDELRSGLGSDLERTDVRDLFDKLNDIVPQRSQN